MQPTVKKLAIPLQQCIDAEHGLLARKMQRVMVPESLPSLEGIDLRALFLPSGVAGGDLFDVIRISEDVIAILMFDVDGQGIEPMLVSAMAKICFVNHINQKVLPYAVVERVNSELFRSIGENIHLKVFVGYLDLHDYKLTYCNTGSTAPMLFRKDTGNIELLDRNEASIGSASEMCFEEHYVHLRQGDALVVFTDGLYCLSQNLKSNESGVIEEVIRSKLLNDATSMELLEEIEATFNHCRDGAEIRDDISVVCVEVLTQSRKNQIKDKLGFKDNDKVYLQFLSYLEDMDRTTATILTALDIAGFQDDDIRVMKIVLTELLVNAIIHGNVKDHSKKVVVGHLIDRDQATVSIMDEGIGFDPSLVPDPTLPENLEKPCGRGLFIVKHYVEAITFNETGNRITIIKKNLFE